MIIDHAHRDGLEILPAGLLAAVHQNLAMVVAIGEHSSTGDLHLGSGFVRNRAVITCCHLVSDLRFWNERSPNLESLRVAFWDGADGFRFDQSVRVDASRSRFFPEWDIAELALASSSARVRARLDAAEGLDVGFDEGQSAAREGVVYGLAAVAEGASSAQASWIPPGRIVFPERVRLKPPDAYLRRAREAEIASEASSDLTRSEVKAASARVDAAYDLALGSRQYAFRFAIPSRSRLPVLSEDSEFRESRRLRCFGTDLVGVGGASGAPIFRLAAGTQVVIGVHAGRVGRESTRSKPASLCYFARAIPMSPVVTLLDE